MDWITERIAIGNIEDVLDYEGLSERGVTGILCLNGFPGFVAHLGLFDWRLVELIDGPGNPPELLRDALANLRELAESHERTLVHCAEGVSRSPFVVACYLAERNGHDLAAAIELVEQKRSDTIVSSQLLPLWEEYQKLSRDGSP